MKKYIAGTFRIFQLFQNFESRMFHVKMKHYVMSTCRFVCSRNGWLEVASYNTFLECFDRAGWITRVFVTVFPARAGVFVCVCDRSHANNSLSAPFQNALMWQRCLTVFLSMSTSTSTSVSCTRARMCINYGKLYLRSRSAIASQLNVSCLLIF